MKIPFTVLVELSDGEVIRLSGIERKIKALIDNMKVFKVGWLCADDKASFDYLFPSKDYYAIRTEQVK